MTDNTIPPLLRFTPAVFERPWGGRALAERFNLPLPSDQPFGEAWLVSDHPVHESVVVDGPVEGETLRTLMQRNPRALLGSSPNPTAQGRFPLLLKLLDAQETLSVQVHPDDAAAARMGENDGGKTEMWHVLAAASDSAIIAGLDPKCTPGEFDTAVARGELDKYLVRLRVSQGDSIYVPAGTVHAIGRGIVLAEIQQNSDLTYRIHDFDRVGPDGSQRELHLEAARKVIEFEAHPASCARPINFPANGSVRRTLESACPYFAAERIELNGEYQRETGGRSFHLLLAVEGGVSVTALGESAPLDHGRVVFVAGHAPAYTLSGTGVVMDYFVADINRDILKPMRAETA